MSSTLPERIQKSLAPVVGNYTKLCISRGEGVWLYGEDGQSYLDFSSGVGVASTGHCHLEVVSAITTQSQKLIHACQGVVYYEPHVKLAEGLVKILGQPFESVFFTQSGTDAVEAAMKLVQYVTGKPQLLAFKGGFHGRTLGSLSITTSKMAYREGYEPLREHVFFPFPYEYRSPWQLENMDFETVASHHLEAFFATLPESVGGVIIEPVLGEGGYVPAPIGFLKTLRRLCSEKNILLIFDEIQTGVGRTGDWFCFQKMGVQPDILVSAKGLASGMPLGCIVASRELMSAWKPGAHGGTYNGNPISTAAGLATLSVIEGVLPRVNPLGDQMVSRLKPLLSEGVGIGDVRGEGLMVGIEFVSDIDTKKPDSDRVKRVMAACLERHLIVINCGVHDNVIRLIPPLIISEEDLSTGMDRFIEAVYATC